MTTTLNDDDTSIEDIVELIGDLIAEGTDTAIDTIDATGSVITIELLNGQVFTLTIAPASSGDIDDAAQAEYDARPRCAHGYIIGSCLADCDDLEDLDGFTAAED